MFKDPEIRLAMKIMLAALITFVLTWTVIKLAPVISLIVIAVFIVYCINPLVSFLISIKLKPLLAAVIASLLILLAVLLLFYLFIPGLIYEMRQLLTFLTTDFIDDLPQLISYLSELDERFNLQFAEIFTEYSSQILAQVPGNVQQLLRTLTGISVEFITRAWIILVTIFLVFYLVQDLDKVRKNLTYLFPQIYKKNVIHILSTVDEKVGAYVRGTLLKCLFVGLLTFIGLTILGMPFTLMLGILAGSFNIILYVGPVVATIPALLLSILPGTPNFFLVLLLYIFVQILDAFVFTPFFLGKATDLSPLTVIVIILIGGQLLGLLGIILAIPITATLKVLVVHYYLEKRNKKPVEETAH